MRIVLKEPKKIVPLCMVALFFLTLYFSNYPFIIKVMLYPVYREIKKDTTVLEAGSFNRIETNEFNIYYRDISKEYLEMIRDVGESSLRILEQDFDFKTGERIDMIIYPEYEEMAKRIGLSQGDIAMGVYYGGVISILEPSKWIRKGADVEKVFRREGPVAHELTHYIVDYMSGGNIPVWFTEGIALYEEYRINGVEWGKYKRYSSYYTSTELESGFYSLDEIKAYKQSFLAVKYIGENYGMEKIKGMINCLKAGKSMDQAIQIILSINIDEIFKRACLQ